MVIQHDRSPVFSRAVLPDPEAGHRSAAVKAARSALASTRAGLDGENDGVALMDSARNAASPPASAVAPNAPAAAPSLGRKWVHGGRIQLYWFPTHRCQRRSRMVWADCQPEDGASGFLTRENAVDRLFPVFL
jgi:hypothetical protein